MIAAALAAVLLAGVVYQAIGAARDARRFPPPGRMINGLHLHAVGSGEPPVVFEAGIGASSLSWTVIAREVARFTTAYCYDRGGLGWSLEFSRPPIPRRLAAELASLLAEGGINSPVVLAAHSFGALVALRFASDFPDRTAALVLVDPLHSEDWLSPTAAQAARLHRGVRLARRGAWLARLGLVRCSLTLLASGMRRLPQLLARASSGNGVGVIERLAREITKLPIETRPLIQAHWSRPKSFRGMASHLEHLPESCADAACIRSIGDIPLTVISAPANASSHESLTRLSSKGRQIVAHGAGHWVQLDLPDLVAAVILEAVKDSAAPATPESADPTAASRPRDCA